MVCKDEGINELAEFCGGGKAVVEWTARLHIIEALATGLDLLQTFIGAVLVELKRKAVMCPLQVCNMKQSISKDQSSVLGSPSMVVAVNGTSECDVTDYWCPILHMVAAVDVTSECDIGVHVGGSLDTTTQLEAIAYTTIPHSVVQTINDRCTLIKQQGSGFVISMNLIGLIEFLDNHNALVRLFRTARDKLKDVDVPKFKVSYIKTQLVQELEPNRSAT
ncbi:hypothetical protein Tco_1085274 [Tanacetum coccineum]